jgi:hypothetical protein
VATSTSEDVASGRPQPAARGDSRRERAFDGGWEDGIDPASVYDMRKDPRGSPAVACLVSFLVLALPAMAAAQTRITPPKNSYTPEQDVELGRQAAAEARRQLPIIEDDFIQSFAEELGNRLVAASPPELNKPVFDYSFTVVNQKEINAFALPGGPMFLNRGMIEAAQSEAEVAGVMAHELSHVLLRHGTANATKAQKFQLGALAGAVVGAIVGGGAGRVIADGSQFGLGTWFLKYSREYERQADLLGTQIMARAGYDPRELASMFETIQRSSRSGGPEWLSSHPNPGNRTEYILREASALEVRNPRDDSADFRRVQAKFGRMSPAPTAEQVAARARKDPGSSPVNVGRIGDPVPPPDGQYRNVRAGDFVSLSVPANWQTLSSNNTLKFVPRNAYGELNGETVFTHGVELGVVRSQSSDLQDATQALLDGLASANPQLRQVADQQATRLSGRQAIATPLVNRSAVGDEERIVLHTTFLSNGNVFYYVTVAPSDEYGEYQSAFDRVGRSIRLSDRRSPSP